MRTKLLLAVLSVSLLAAAPPASAATACFNLSPFCDVLQLDFTAGSSGMVEWAGGWWACPPRPGSVYNLAADGGVFPLGGGSGAFHVTVQATHSTGFFGNSHLCILDSTITAPGFTGPFLLECMASPNSGGFVNSGTLVPIACPAPGQIVPGEPIGGR